MTEYLTTQFHVAPETASYLIYFAIGLFYYIATALIHYLDNKYSGKQNSTVLNFILFLVKKVLARIEPGKVGRSIVEKRNPEAINAQRAEKDIIDWNLH